MNIKCRKCNRDTSIQKGYFFNPFTGTVSCKNKITCKMFSIFFWIRTH